MAREKPLERATRDWSRSEKRASGGIGKGPQKNPTKGTKNPFTENLKVKEPPSSGGS